MMKTTVFFSTALIALLSSPVAWAAHSETNRGYRATWSQVEEVQRLAHEVEDRSRLVHRSAERLAHHGDFQEERALARLHELEERAEHFHRQVERNRQNVGHTEEDFRDLSQAYRRAAYAMHDLHAFGKIDREFDRLSDAMYDLEMYAEDLFDQARPAHRRYRDRGYWDHRSRGRSHGRVAVPRLRLSWDWFLD
jgi:chromosome segregation ATPase